MELVFDGRLAAWRFDPDVKQKTRRSVTDGGPFRKRRLFLSFLAGFLLLRSRRLFLRRSGGFLLGRGSRLLLLGAGFLLLALIAFRGGSSSGFLALGRHFADDLGDRRRRLFLDHDLLRHVHR